jgi:serine/threonine protein kinase/N-acetylneuraminic acid mutarotase
MALDQEAVAAALPLYEVEGELGHGAWGVVLAGRHRQLRRDVAIKQLPRSFGTDPAVRSRFIAEARLLASLEHPHVVPLYDFVEHEGLCLLVMERLTGGTLWSRARSGNVTPQSSCALILATLSALQYAHQRGVLHRDIKPENLMFSGKGDLKVTDFGIAKVVGGAATVATRAGDVLGTPAYMAPEQAMGEELSPATDIYAVGTVLYELLSGTLPFPEDSNPIAMLYRHVHEEPKPLLDIAPHVPFKLAEVTQQSLARHPGDRYSDAESFAVALAEAASQTWGPGWLPGSGMTVSTSGPVLSAATGQTGRLSGETLAPARGPRETPVAQEPASSGLVPVSALLPELPRTSPPLPVTPPPEAVPAFPPAAASAPPPGPPPPPPPPETQAAPRVPAPPPGTPPPPPSEPAPAPARGRRPWLIAVPVALVAVIVLIVALLASGGSNKTLKTQAAAALDAGQWAPVQNAPTPRQELASAVDDGKIWVLGGLNGSDSTAKVESYDPGTNAWSAGPDLPLPLHHEMAATYKGEIMAVGGWVPENGVLTAKTSDQVFALRAGKWVGLPHLKHPRAAGAAAVAGNKLVVFGGQADGKLVSQTEVWDGKSWSDGPALPSPRDHLAAASDGNFVYAVGGRFLSADKNVATLDRYDPSANSWSKLPDMPTARGDLGASVVGGRLVAVGGESSTGVFSTVESFDINKRQWSALPNMRTPRHGITVDTVGTSVYAIDGAQVPSHGQATNVNEVLPFTPAASTTAPAAPAQNASSPWRAVHDAPTARLDAASTVDDGVVWVMGGVLGPNAATAKVEGYDPAIDTWKSGPDLPLPLNHAMAVTYNGEILVMGGFVPDGGNLTAHASNKVFALEGNSWVEKPAMNAPRAAGAAAVVGDRLVVVGGQADGQLLPFSETFDGNQWTQAPGMPTPRQDLAAVSDDHFVYAIGGQGLSPDSILGAFEQFDPATGKWKKGPSLQAARGGLGAAVVNGTAYAVGGETPVQALGTVEAFDLASGSAWTPGPPMSARHGLAVQAVGPAVYAIDGGRQPGPNGASKVAEVLRP